VKPSVTIVVEPKGVQPATVENALKSTGGEVTPIGASRGVGGDVLKWVLKFTGDAGKLGEALVQQATKQLAGATVKIQLGQTIVEVSNANRSQVLAILKQASDLASASEGI
jgi:hypothetical protein